MRLKRLALALVGGVGLALVTTVPAYAFVQVPVFTISPSVVSLNGTATLTGQCQQIGNNATLQDCVVQVFDPNGVEQDTLYTPTSDPNTIDVTQTLPTNVVGQWHVIMVANGTGTGGGSTQTSTPTYYNVTNPPPGPPTAQITSPTPGSNTNPGSNFSLNSSCTVGANAAVNNVSLSSCNANVTYPDGSNQTNPGSLSGWGGPLPTGASGWYGVTVTATDSDNQTGNASTSYFVNYPPTVTITDPVNGAVLNQNDSYNSTVNDPPYAPHPAVPADQLNAGCAVNSLQTANAPEATSITNCEYTYTDPNGAVTTYNNTPPAQIPDGIVGTWTLQVTATDSNGLTATQTTTYRVNEYPTINIAYPFADGTLKLYTGDYKPSNFTCDDHEADNHITGPLKECDATVNGGSSFTSGANVDTSSAGVKTMTVTAVDADNAESQRSIGYQVFDRPSAVITSPGAGASYNPWDSTPDYVGSCAGGMGILTCSAQITSPSGVTKPFAVGDPLPTSQWGTWTITETAVDAQGTRAVVKQTYVVKTPPAPVLKAHVNHGHVALRVGSNGQALPSPIADVVTISGWHAGAASVKATVTLYGPSAKPHTCLPGKAVRTFKVPVNNGQIVTSSIPINVAGYYSWTVSVPSNLYNRAASVPCSSPAQSTLANRVAYGAPVVSTGFNGVLNLLAGGGSTDPFLGRLALNANGTGIPARVTAPGVNAVLQTAGIAHGQMSIPADTRVGAWLRNSADLADLLGNTVLAGHVSNYYDQPGAFNRVQFLRKGQIVKVADRLGRTYRFRVTSVRTYTRTKALPASVFQTKGAHALVLITCTDEIRYPDGHFHYRKNIVVTATPVNR